MKEDEPRIITQTGLEARIGEIAAPVLQADGFRLVQVRISGQYGLTVQIMAERADGTLTIDDCAAISRALSPVLDVADPIAQAYHLEVSSPGMDRPLVRVSDFVKWRDHVVKIVLQRSINGRKTYRGRIVAVDDDGIVLVPSSCDKGGHDVCGDATQALRFDQMARAHLVLTDALVDAALGRQSDTL